MPGPRPCPVSPGAQYSREWARSSCLTWPTSPRSCPSARRAGPPRAPPRCGYPRSRVLSRGLRSTRPGRSRAKTAALRWGPSFLGWLRASSLIRRWCGREALSRSRRALTRRRWHLDGRARLLRGSQGQVGCLCTSSGTRQSLALPRGFPRVTWVPSTSSRGSVRTAPRC